MGQALRSALLQVLGKCLSTSVSTNALIKQALQAENKSTLKMI